ncbi:MAG TPA: hypothetical protein VJS88_02280 [Chthoniobacterales bacterium]|nr:hypothetical protein [Chthoniobacterales bacterium]
MNSATLHFPLEGEVKVDRLELLTFLKFQMGQGNDRARAVCLVLSRMPLYLGVPFGAQLLRCTESSTRPRVTTVGLPGGLVLTAGSRD